MRTNYNQSGYAATIHSIVPDVIREVTGTTEFVRMPDEWFAAGKAATEVAPNIGQMADNSNCDLELYRERLKRVYEIAEDFVRSECGDVGVALLREQAEKKLTRYGVWDDDPVFAGWGS